MAANKLADFVRKLNIKRSTFGTKASSGYNFVFGILSFLFVDFSHYPCRCRKLRFRCETAAAHWRLNSRAIFTGLSGRSCRTRKSSVLFLPVAVQERLHHVPKYFPPALCASLARKKIKPIKGLRQGLDFFVASLIYGRSI